MSRGSGVIGERVLQLMADYATEGLVEAELTELNGYFAANTDPDSLGLERAAAALDLACMPEAHKPLPHRVRDRILTDAGRYFGAVSTPDSRLPAPQPALRPEARRWSGRTTGYLVAASLFLAMLGWWQVLSLRSSPVESATRQYSEFLREARDVIRIPWAGQQPDYQQVSGEAAWSQESQKGFLRFVGLARNNPKVSQYQLWIVDPSRDKHPIDGGVFDVSGAGETIVSINAKLLVENPKAFAVTLEKPGGVVVSDGPLLVVGTVPG